MKMTIEDGLRLLRWLSLEAAAGNRILILRGGYMAGLRIGSVNLAHVLAGGRLSEIGFTPKPHLIVLRGHDAE